jgi:hypothetical protein
MGRNTLSNVTAFLPTAYPPFFIRFSAQFQRQFAAFDEIGMTEPERV